MKNKIFIYLFDGFADWEIAFLTPEIKKNEALDLIYFSIDGKSVQSIGGLHISPDMSLSEIIADEVYMLILPGGTAWLNGGNKEIDQLTKTLFDDRKTIAAICAATIYLGKQGFLDHLKHTSNDLSFLKQIAPQYAGENHYIDSPAVSDENIITANGTAAIEFARKVFEKLDMYSEQDREKWFQLFKNGIWKT
jgi:putative intracellular protease/amidase